MKKIILLIGISILVHSASAQTKQGPASDTVKVKKPKEQVDVVKMDTVDDSMIFVVVEEMPEFPGGQGAMARFIIDSLVYPKFAIENNIQGKVIVQFIIDKKGKVTDVKVVSKPLGFGCDEEAIRVVESMPNWKPGKQRGKPVKVRFVLPIRFQLTNDTPPAKPQK